MRRVSSKLDAMMRQPFNPTAIPFQPNVIGDSTVLSALNYDLGPNGVAYYDNDTANYRVSDPKLQGGNRGHFYRNDGVDITTLNRYSGPLSLLSAQHNFVSDFESGEWLQYTTYVQEKGAYAVTLTPIPDPERAKVSIWVDGKKMTDKVSLNPGKHIFRVRVDEGNIILGAITFIRK